MKEEGERGFTLVELITVIGLMAIVTAIATLNFTSMRQSRQMESEIRQMQADFENVRVSAMTSKRNYSIVLAPASYAFLSYSGEGDTAGTVRGGQQLRFPIKQFLPSSGSGSYSAFSSTNNNNQLSIDPRGCLTSPSAPFYVALDPASGNSDAAVNVLALQTAKTNIGVIQGGSCALQ